VTDNTRPVLVIGRRGQLAQSLSQLSDDAVFFICRGREDGLDITDATALAAALDRHAPDIVVNAAAYTAVDRAEDEPDAAFRLNRDAPAELARACDRRGIPVIHLSTDYVFDGTKREAYVEDDPIAPLSVYGASKAAGEAALRQANARHVILRTSWLYSRFGSNFVKTILRHAEDRQEIEVVADQHGCPTAAEDVAGAIKAIVGRLRRNGARPYGTFHLAGQGTTTWCGLASAIVTVAAEHGGKAPRIKPIRTADFPTRATRPRNSALACGKLAEAYGVRLPLWPDSVRGVVTALAAGGASR